MNQKVQVKDKKGGFPPELVKRLSVVVSIFIFCMFVIQPLIMHGKQLYPMSDGSQMYTRYLEYTEFKLSSFITMFIIMLVALLVVIIHYAFTKPNWRSKTFKEWLADLKIYDYALIGFILFIGISALIRVISKDGELAHTAIWGIAGGRNEGFLVMLCYVLVIWIVGHWGRPKQWHFFSLTITAAIISLYGILQFYMIDPLALNFPGMNSLYQLGSLATISNRDFASTYLCLSFFICFVQFTQQDSKLRWIYFACLLPIIFSITLMRTLSGIIGIIGAAVLLFPFFVRKRKFTYRSFFMLGSCLFIMNLAEYIREHAIQTAGASFFGTSFFGAIGCFVIAGIVYMMRDKKPLSLPSEKKMRIIWPLALLGIVTIFIVLLPVVASEPASGIDVSARIKNMLHEIYQMIYHGNFDDNLGSQRMFVWKRMIPMILENPVFFMFGHGPDSFKFYFNKNYGLESQIRYRVEYDKAHNEFLQIWFDNGIFAVLSWILFGLSAIWTATKRAVKQPVVLAVGATMLCYFIQSFFNLSMPGVSASCWAMWGVLIALIRNPENAEELDDIQIGYTEDEEEEWEEDEEQVVLV